MSVTKLDRSLPPPPFLTKTFDMVNDYHTDSIVSWSPSSDNSFVVWDFYELSAILLPQFFKHNNFSTFVRQLNAYGFRKAQPDRWEFSHEEFRKGQRHRLKNINRKWPAVSSKSMTMVPTVHPFAHVDVSLSQAWKGVGMYQAVPAGGESEIQQLKSETNEIRLELDRLSSKRQAVHQHMKYMSDRLQALEMSQQQISAFIARNFCGQSLFYQCMHQAMAADRIRTQLKPLDEAWEEMDASSSEARKRPRILKTYTDAYLSGIESAISVDYNKRQMHLQPQRRKWKAACCQTIQDTGMWMTTGTDDNETSANYDQKQVSDHSNMCVHSRQVKEEDYANATSVYQIAGRSKGSASSALRNVVQDAEIGINTCMKQPVIDMNGPSAMEKKLLETTVDLNWQPLTLPDSFFCSAGTCTQVPQESSSAFFQNLESDVFWEKLLSPVTVLGVSSRNGSECA